MTFVVAISMPKGARPMNELDIRRVKWGQMVDVLDTHTGKVTRCAAVADAKDGSVRVKFKGGHEEVLGAANVDEQFIAITTQLADELDDPNNALAVALRASNEIAKLTGRIRVAEETIHRLANELQARPTQQQYDAIHAELNHLRDDIRALSLKRAS